MTDNKRKKENCSKIFLSATTNQANCWPLLLSSQTFSRHLSRTTDKSNISNKHEKLQQPKVQACCLLLPNSDFRFKYTALLKKFSTKNHNLKLSNKTHNFNIQTGKNIEANDADSWKLSYKNGSVTYYSHLQFRKSLRHSFHGF